MEYRHLSGPVYCRYALTPPIINCDLAHRYGIVTRSPVELGQGKSVKLRMVLDDNTKRVTCHGIVDWVRLDEGSGDYDVGLSHLSLSELEFATVVENFVEESDIPLEVGESVRDKGLDASPVVSENLREIRRIKAITLPVGLIEAIDLNRGKESFSEFVAHAIEVYLNK